MPDDNTIPIPFLLFTLVINPVSLIALLIRAFLDRQGIAFTRIGDLALFGPVISVGTALLVFGGRREEMLSYALFLLFFFWCAAGALASGLRHHRGLSQRSTTWWTFGAYVGMSLFSLPLTFAVGSVIGFPNAPDASELTTLTKKVRAEGELQEAQIEEKRRRREEARAASRPRVGPQTRSGEPERDDPVPARSR